MITFLINILITFIFTLFTLNIYDDLPETAFLAILVFLGWYIVTWLFSYFYSKTYFRKMPKVVGLVGYYLQQLMVASLKVATEIITPGNQMRPAFIAVPLDATTDLEITLLANLITLTPGTLSLDISEDRKTLFIHEMYVPSDDLEQKVQEIKRGFEKRILLITR